MERAAAQTAARYDWSIIAGRFEAALADVASASAPEKRLVGRMAQAV